MRNFLWSLIFLLCASGAGGGPAPLRSDVDTASLALPEMGDVFLTVLSPDTIEITRIAAEEGAWPIGAGMTSPSTALTGLRVQSGAKHLEIVAAGWKRRPVYADFHRADLRLALSLCLQLRRPAAEPRCWLPAIEPDDPVYVIDTAGVLLAPGKVLHASSDPRRLSPVLHVNQEGYAPDLPKMAMVGYFLGDLGELPVSAGTPFTVLDARSYETVFAGTLSARPELGGSGSPTYQHVLEADFSALRLPGEYRLAVPGLGTSYPFLIDDRLPWGVLRTYALGLYEQRCGTALTLPFTRFVHDACHLAPAEIPEPATASRFDFTWKTIAQKVAERPTEATQAGPSLIRPGDELYPFVRTGTVDVSGGHHDAGDYSKYTENSAELLHFLLFAADNVPLAQTADNLGLPESGDGIPDVLEEARWEADFLIKLQDADGGFYFLVYPRDREYEGDVLPDHGDPQVVWPKNTAVTGAAVAALAEAGSSPAMRRHCPEQAARYLSAARRGWDFLTRALAAHGREGAYQKITFYGDRYGHDDEMAWAAAALFAATGEKDFETQLFTWLPDPADPRTYRWGWWRMSEGWGNAIRVYAFAARSGRLPGSALDARYLGACEQQIVAAADDLVTWSADSAYAAPLENPTKAVHGGGWHFALDQVSDVAVASLILSKPDYLPTIVGALNFESGSNPVNRPFLTGIGIPRQREIVSQYAENDRRALPPSGIPIGYVQPGFDLSPLYGARLRDAWYPVDYPLLDRWVDVHNTNTEYIAVNQARALLSAAFLAGTGTRSVTRPWRAAEAKIGPLPAAPQLGVPLALRLLVTDPSLPLTEARVVWEARGQPPAFGPEFAFTPVKAGRQWVEAEAEWPDGRRVFATAEFDADSPTLLWFKGESGPDGAAAARHQEGELSETAFTGAPEPMEIRPGDRLYVWVRVDPAHPPREILLAWNDGSWEHRAYWGANEITYGRDGTAGRRGLGALPTPGRWERLVVPAAALGLERQRVTGMSWSVLGGRAEFGAVGREREP